MKSSKIAAVVLALALPLAVHAVEVAGVQVDERQQANGQELVLNGAGLRSIAFFKVYVASLYVTKRAGSAAQVLDSAEPTRMNLRLLRNIEADRLIKSLHEGMADNVSETELAALQTPLQQLDTIMRKVGAAKSGDNVVLDIKGDSVTVSFNGNVLGTVSAPRFGRALLSIWLGEHPIDSSLKKALLGA